MGERAGRSLARGSAAALALGFAFAPIARTAPASPTDAASCVAADLDRCYRRDQMAEFAEAGARMVTEYLSQIGITADPLPRLAFIPAGKTTASQCVDADGHAIQNDRSYDYCPTDNAVYIGQNSLWDAYRRYGAAGPVSGIAHEYGHFLQSVRQVPNPRSADDTIRHEDQADCFSGAFIGFLRDGGRIASSKAVDIIERYLTATASADAPGRDHGTAGERIDSFALGLTGELPACSRFFPATPLTG